MLVLVLAAMLAATPSYGQEAAGALSLERAVDLALENSRDLRDAELGLAEAKGRVREAWGGILPQVDLSASYTRNLTVPGTFLPRVFVDPDAGPDELVAVRFGSDNMWNLQVRAEQPLFQGRAFVGVGAASHYEALQQEVVRGRAQGVVTRVRIAFYDVLLAEEAVRLTGNTVERIRQTLDETRKMERAGIASNYDVLRLEVELANVEPALRRARNAAAAARRSLAVEIGLDDLTEVGVQGSLQAVNVDSLVAAASAEAGDVDMDAVIARAWGDRSEARQLELTERLRRAELRAEQSEYLPRLSLFGTYSLNAQQSGNPVFFGESEKQRSYGRQVGVQLTLPLFAGLQRPAREAQLKAVVEQVRTQRELTEDRIRNQVRTVADQLDEARLRLRAQALGVTQATRGFAIATAQYREGISSALELTDAEVALRQSEFNFAEAVYDVLVATARLEEATGAVHFGGVNMVRER